MGASPQEQADALARIVPLVCKAERLYGVPAELTTAHAMIESGWMRDVVGHSNCFGMKKTGRHKMSAWKDDTEFADYPTIEAAVMDYAWLISCGSPYARAWLAFKSNQHDWQTLARGVAAVYAKGRWYADLIIAVATMNNVSDAISKGRKP